MFFSVIGLFVALVFVAIVYSLFAPTYVPEEKTSLTILPDLQDKQDALSMASPVVLRVNIDGLIGIPNQLTGETIEDILIHSRDGLLHNNRVKAILLHIDTPGGTVTDSDTIYRLLKAYKEKYKTPIYAYVDGMCASGGMYVASAADKVYASPPSIIGSVGVVMGPLFNFTGTMDKLGIESKTFTAGIDKDELNPFRPWKADEGASLKVIMSFLYHRFVDIVTNARPNMDKNRLVNEYGARIFDGPDALERGYIDVADADYKLALHDLLVAAQIDIEKPYQVVELDPKVSFFDNLAKSSLLTGKLEHVLPLADKKPTELNEQFLYLFGP